jgi:hypothetical protein
MTRLPKCSMWIVALLLGQALLSKADVSQPPSGTWEPTGGAMTEARTAASAALLPDGSVLTAGNCELYDRGGFFTSTTPMHVARAQHASATVNEGHMTIR